MLPTIEPDTEVRPTALPEIRPIPPISQSAAHPMLQPRPTINALQPMDLWAFLENSDFQRRKGPMLYRQDEVELIRHDKYLEVDYQLMVDIGCKGIRDAARW